MLGAYDLRAGRDLYRATSAFKRGLALDRFLRSHVKDPPPPSSLFHLHGVILLNGLSMDKRGRLLNTFKIASSGDGLAIQFVLWVHEVCMMINLSNPLLKTKFIWNKRMFTLNNLKITYYSIVSMKI